MFRVALKMKTSIYICNKHAPIHLNWEQRGRFVACYRYDKLT
jgi:hypothetical protein